MPAIIRWIKGLQRIWPKIIHFIAVIPEELCTGKKINPHPNIPGLKFEWLDNAGKNQRSVDKLTRPKHTVIQVVLLKTGIFAVPLVFVEKQMKKPYNI